MRERSGGHLVDGHAVRTLQGPQDKQLRRAQSDAPLAVAGRLVKALDDAPNGIEQRSGIVGRRRCMGPIQ